ncbi:MAG: hypothetical protein JWM34_5194 [Ilumatobacteraceae bacterium]|nr:hypothetical protein [Ilumatobacteraceae bacterium]
MSSLGGVVRAGVRRRRTQTIVTVIAALVAVASAVLGLTLLRVSAAPFDRSFGQQHGAHLSVAFSSTTTPAELHATTTASGVTEAAGPFATVTVSPTFHPGAGAPTGTPTSITLSPATIVGRTSADRSIDAMSIEYGRWPTGRGEVAVAVDGNLPTEIGATISFPDLPGGPVLTIVGAVHSVSRTADAWVVPDEIGALSATGRPDGEQMLYRFDHASTAADMSRDRAAISAAAGTTAVAGTQSWLDLERAADRSVALFVPFLIAFGALGIVMSVLVVGGVVAGSVSSGLHRIGILKTLGFTPGQVVRAYASQALIPALLGIGLGVIAGTALTNPVLSTADQVYGTIGSSMDLPIDAAVAIGAILVVAAASIAAAWRGGRMTATAALATGRAPHTGRGRAASRIAGRIALPRPVTLGLAQPFARPMRTAALALAIVFGATSVTFAVGLSKSLAAVQQAKNHDNADVVVGTNGEANGPKQINRDGSTPPDTTAADAARISALIAAEPGTARSFSVGSTDVIIPGRAGSTTVYAFSGDATWSGYQLVTGHWFQQPGDAVVPGTFMTATGTKLGDTVSLLDHGHTLQIHLVGEVFDPHTQDMEVLTDRQTIAAADPDLVPDQFSIGLTRGTDAASYITTLDAALQPFNVSAVPGASTRNGSDQIAALEALTAALTLTLIVVAALGVLNSVVLDTRDRLHDLGVHTALGMTPRQTVSMVLASVTVVGVIGGLLGVPIGLLAHHIVMPAMGRAAGVRLPRSVLVVFTRPELAFLAGGGIVIALLGALLPAKWAASVRTVTALRTE